MSSNLFIYRVKKLLYQITINYYHSLSAFQDSQKTENELRKELLKLQENYKRELDRMRTENEQLKYLVKNSNLKTNTVKVHSPPLLFAALLFNAL